jgi:hypothetical protein
MLTSFANGQDRVATPFEAIVSVEELFTLNPQYLRGFIHTIATNFRLNNVNSLDASLTSNKFCFRIGRPSLLEENQ